MAVCMGKSKKQHCSAWNNTKVIFFIFQGSKRNKNCNKKEIDICGDNVGRNLKKNVFDNSRDNLDDLQERNLQLFLEVR
jgi:hypothetical protein